MITVIHLRRITLIEEQFYFLLYKLKTWYKKKYTYGTRLQAYKRKISIKTWISCEQ